eukprot:7087460-Ditylum_brightwellii.AAC.1
MLMLPEIIVGLHFEREMGLYFEVTSKWHGTPGSLSTHYEFQLLELHALWFEFIAPWWKSSTTNLKKNFSKTFETVATIPDKDIRTMKNDQVVAGINASYNEIVKLSQFLLNIPVLFAAFTGPKYGPSLSRAVVNVVEESETNWMDYQFDNTWG